MVANGAYHPALDITDLRGFSPSHKGVACSLYRNSGGTAFALQDSDIVSTHTSGYGVLHVAFVDYDGARVESEES